MKPKTKLWFIRFILLPLWLPFAMCFLIAYTVFWLIHCLPDYFFALMDYLMTGKWETSKDDYD